MNRAERRRQQKLADKTASRSPLQRSLTSPQTLSLALQHHSAGRLSEAESLYRQLLQADPNQPDALHFLGVIACQFGKNDIAVDLINKAIAIKPDYADAHSNLGNALKGLGKLDQALTSYHKAIAINPDHADAHSNLGSALKGLGKLDEAVASYRKALAINPDLADAHYNLGNTLKELGMLDEAVASYNKVLAVKPDYVDAHTNLGNALKDLGKLNEAVASYHKALAIKPNLADAHFNLGNALKGLGKLEQAVTSYHKAIAIKPDHADAHSNLGSALRELGKLDEAVTSYRKAIAINPDFAGAYSNLGSALKELGKRDEAVASYHKAITINPGLHSAQHILNSMLGTTTDSAPIDYVKDLFDGYADHFEHKLLNDLSYSMPSLLKDIFLESGLVEGKLSRAIDLGCGTGLLGDQFKSLVEVLVGIDLSANMIVKAEEKNIYDELYVDELVEGLDALSAKFDLFLASDVFVYVGNLSPIFESIERHAQKDALLLFSTEHTNGEGFILQDTGRYAHTKDYVFGAAEKFGFQLEHFSTTDLRKDKNIWITGGIYMFRCG
ncbi:MAG: tetratricopeptide repeat protein [Rhodospirillales bacterium]|nr:tetratricopeptide repeat protein [Rhodospirillales bacterium]